MLRGFAAAQPARPPRAVARILDDAGLPPAKLCLEITHRALVVGPTATARRPAGIADEAAAAVIVGGVITVGHALGLAVVGREWRPPLPPLGGQCLVVLLHPVVGDSLGMTS